MSVLDNQTKINPTTSFFATSGGGGGGGGSNIVASTITLTGSTQPLSITLPAAANDGFEVRQGGGTNPIAILTIDEADNNGTAEFGIRSISTISGNPVPIARFEMSHRPASPTAQLTYTRDEEGLGNASTIGVLSFAPGDGGDTAGKVAIVSENGGLQGPASLTIGNYQVIGNSLACLNPRVIAPTTNIYVPAAGTTQTVATFSTLTNHVYELFVPNLRVQNQPAGAPAAGAWSQLIVDIGSGALETFDMASVSSVANDLQTSRSYSFIATADGHNLQAIGSLSNTVSTAMTFPQPLLLRDLGNLALILPANAAP